MSYQSCSYVVLYSFLNTQPQNKTPTPYPIHKICLSQVPRLLIYCENPYVKVVCFAVFRRRGQTQCFNKRKIYEPVLKLCWNRKVRECRRLKPSSSRIRTSVTFSARSRSLSLQAQFLPWSNSNASDNTLHNWWPKRWRISFIYPGFNHRNSLDVYIYILLISSPVFSSGTKTHQVCCAEEKDNTLYGWSGSAAWE